MSTPNDFESELDALLDQALALDTATRATWLENLARHQPEHAKALQKLLHADHAFEQRVANASEVLNATSRDAIAAHTWQGQQLLGPWRLLERVGEGGMGEVWKAERADGQFEKIVAIKLLDLALRRSVLVERFTRERHILARLQHPNIAPLLDAGLSPQGTPYLVLEFVEGNDIRIHVQEQHLSWQAVTQLILQAADALSHAHQQLIVHRDLKPSNVLVDANGQVKLLDFGIAKMIDPDTGMGDTTQLTSDSGRVFTPAYAAPEQRTGGRTSTATDVYGLALVLQELLLGDRDAVLESFAEFQRRAQTQRNITLPREMFWILRRALQVDPARRYSSMEAMAHDLRQMLAMRPVQAGPDAVSYRAKRFLQRHRTAMLSGLAGLIAISVAAYLYVQQARETERQRDLAQQERDLVVRTAEQLDASLEFTTMMLGELRELPMTEGADMHAALIARGESMLQTEVSANLGARLQAAETLASLHMKAGDAKSAARLFEAILSGAHGEVATSQQRALHCKLAMAKTELGEFDLARVQFESMEKLPIGGDRHSQVFAAQCLMWQGTLLSRSGNEAEGLKLREMALPKIIQLEGANSLAAARAYNELATALTLAGKFDKAIATFEKSLTLFQRHGLSRSYDAVAVMGGLAINLERIGRLKEAEAYHRQSLAVIRERKGSPGNLSNRLINYGRNLTNLGRDREAFETLQEGLQLTEANSGKNNLFYLSGAMAMSLIEARRGNRQQAETWLQVARQSNAAQGRDPHPSSGMLWFYQASIEKQFGEHAIAENSLRKGMVILKQGGDLLRRGYSLSALLLVDCLMAQGRTDAARAILVSEQNTLQADAGVDANAIAAWQLRLIEAGLEPTKLSRAQILQNLIAGFDASHELVKRARAIQTVAQ